MPDTDPIAPAPPRYDPSFTHPEDNEAATDAALVETMRGISETTFKDSARFRGERNGCPMHEPCNAGDLPG